MAEVLALDFDGVIVDSIRETFTIAVRVFAAHNPSARLSGHPMAAAGRRRPELFPFTEDPTFCSFLDMVPLGNRAEDYAVILDAIEEGVAVADQSAYDKLYRQRDHGWLEEAHAQFYAGRARLREESFETWRLLQEPYEPLINLLRRHAGRMTLAVVTARDAESVDLLVEAWGLGDLFSPGLVFDKRYGINKTAHLRGLFEKLSVAPGDVTFVDDKLNHLQRVAPLGVRPVLAAWGYNTPREHRLAARAGIPVAHLDDAEALLFAG